MGIEDLNLNFLLETEAPPLLPLRPDAPIRPIFTQDPLIKPQIPYGNPELAPKPIRPPWDGYAAEEPDDKDYPGYPVEGWPDGTIYYPGFGWVIPPLPPNDQPIIVEENPDGSPNFDDVWNWDPNSTHPTQHDYPSWDIDEDGNPVFYIPGWGQWWPHPEGDGGFYISDDGTVWYWHPIHGWQRSGTRSGGAVGDDP